MVPLINSTCFFLREINSQQKHHHLSSNLLSKFFVASANFLFWLIDGQIFSFIRDKIVILFCLCYVCLILAGQETRNLENFQSQLQETFLV